MLNLVRLKIVGDSSFFLDCSLFGSLWHLVHHWLGFDLAHPVLLLNHFIQFGNLVGTSKAKTSIMFLIWRACTWIIWKERNSLIFNNKECSTIKFLYNVQLISFCWLNTIFTNLVFDYHRWWLSPLQCMGIG